MATTIKTTFKLRRGSSADWERVNPILAAGEPGFVTDKNILKVGDGVTPFMQLAPIGEAADLSDITNELKEKFEIDINEKEEMIIFDTDIN